MSTSRVDYDGVAATFDDRYERYEWRGTEAFVRKFVRDACSAAEIGCGTGHWLGTIADLVPTVIGIEPSAGMLQRARAAMPSALLVRATAEMLPLASASTARVFCVNALHHFLDQRAFVRECRRVLRPGGGFTSIGLDPHSALDSWWIYEYFPAALSADQRRFGSAAGLRAQLRDAGFERVTTEVAQHAVAEVPFDQAERTGLLDRNSSSQFLVISDDEYAAGVDRLRELRPTLRTDLRLFATNAWLEE